jgi:hypothetical protein
LDPRLESVEVALNEGNWPSICEQLGSLDESGRLPPTLGIVAAVAYSEVMAHREDMGDTGSQAAASELAMRCVASLFGVTETSPIARVLAKRLLRRIPRTTGGPHAASPSSAAAPAAGPPVAVHFLVGLLFLVAGAIAGWLLAGRRLPF